MPPPPVVTGLSPIEGPPGTRIIIRGENFGTKSSDLIGLKICGCDCLLSAEWKSPNKIIARSGPGKGKGDVIITTRFNGIGTCNVSFKGYHETIGPMKESAVWVEEAPLFVWGRHSLSPGSYQQEDPLGLSVEGNDKKFPEDDLLELFPNATGDIASENFSACWFLLENHHCTSFNDLQAGLLHLRRKVEGQKEGQLSFLKANVGSVMDQADTIATLMDKCEKDAGIYGSESTRKLEKSIKESEREARKLFDDVLTRRDRAEKTRNALNVLARFRFLFCLPCVIDRNIRKGEYDIVINDYTRVKNLFNKSEVPVFKTALSEIEKRVVGLQKMLHDKLQKMPIPIEEQKRLIRYLVNLDAPYEPAWDAIRSYSNYINLRFKQCYEEHKAGENAVAEELCKMKNSQSASKYSKFNSTYDSLNTVPENVLFVEDLCQLLSELFPDLWKLGQSYFTGELHANVEVGHQANFKNIVMTIIELFCKTLRSAVIPHTLDKTADKALVGAWTIPDIDIIALWLPVCLRYVRATYKILIKLDLPSEALDLISTFILDFKLYCMSVLLKQTTEQVRQLSNQENWKIEFAGNRSGITELPIEFEELVQTVIRLIKESVLTTEQREISLLDNSSAQKELDKQVETLLSSFYGVLKGLAFQDDDSGYNDDHSPVVSQLIGTPITAYRNHDTSNHVPVWECRLLTTLSNCQYTNGTVLLHISESFTMNGYSLSKLAIENVRTKFISLEKALLDAYLEHKSDPLVGTIEPSMYLGRFDWDTNNIPSDIRPYAKECINNLIHVHSEVYTVSPSLVDSVLPQVVQTIAEELFRLMSCVKKFSLPGVQQARADICALQEILLPYSTPKAKTFFNDALEIIPPLEKSSSTIIQDILKQVRVRMRLQILCLSTPTINGPVKT
ncbi:hypothetical protein RI129_011818 [Pyrocoelia pectoralis]|uniref:Exocyst complex component 2 n=1 Tax=Pyrocoelia pectoralis TaxID=417401 RepID=A0AAN7V5J1_9COLE